MRIGAGRATAVVGALGVCCAPGAAVGEVFRPAVDSRGFVTANASDALARGELSFGLVTHWGARPGVEHVFTPTLVGAVGVGARLELGVALPFRVISVVDGAPGADEEGLGDAGASLKLRVWRGLGVLGAVDRGGGARATLVVDRRLGPVRAAVNVGVDREARVPSAAAVAWSVVHDRVELLGEVYGDARGVGGREAALGVKVYLARSSYFLLGAGVGLGGGAPDARVFLGIVFEPRPGGRDGDGAGAYDDDPPVRIAQAEPLEDAGDAEDDALPPEPDDELDSDGDGIVDLDDLCPKEPGVRERAGCPARELAVRTRGGIVTLEQIHFETNSAVIQERSYPLLDAVAQALAANPDLRRIEIQGHTDERNTRAYNQRLSQARAEAVRDYLVGKGIDPDRLVPVGYGEDDPVDPRHHRDAWARNRRVEFVILDP